MRSRGMAEGEAEGGQDGDLHLLDLNQGEQVVHEAGLEGGREEHEGVCGQTALVGVLCICLLRHLSD